jgi:hypothetical protein
MQRGLLASCGRCMNSEGLPGRKGGSGDGTGLQASPAENESVDHCVNGDLDGLG